MAINIRRVGEVADGSVTQSKLADGAVDLESDIVVGELPSSKIKNGAVVEEKLANLSISTDKLQDNVVTLAKANDDVRLKSFVGDETLVSVTGLTESIEKELTIPKDVVRFGASKIRVLAGLYSSDAAFTASLKVYIDSETTERLELTSNSETSELVSGEFDISDLGAGKHSVKISLVSSDVAGTAYNDLIDIMVVTG